MYVACHDVLCAAGYEHYEISSYALPGRRSRHNSLYWTMGAYLGLGVSAASFLPLVSGDGYRSSNARSLSAYLTAIGAHPRQQGSDAAQMQPESDQAAHLPAHQLEEEALWLALRTSDGVDRQAHCRAYGHDPLALPGRAAAAQTCVDAGWLDVTPEHLRLLPAGFLFADEVTVRLWGTGKPPPA